MNTINTIYFIRSKNIKKSVNILNAEGVYNLYLGENFAVIDTGEKNGDFEQFLNNKEINLIIVSENLKKEPKLKNDMIWRDFLVNYSKYQFDKYDVPNSTNKVYIKINLLS